MKTIKHTFPGKSIQIPFFLLIALIFLQCEGPQGPPGYDGRDGIDGLSAYSAIYEVLPADWEGNADGYWAYLEVPEINDDIYYDGAVLVYRLTEIDPYSFNMLPFTFIDDTYSCYMSFEAYVGSIDIFWKEVVDGVNDTYSPDELITFKVVIVEGIPLDALKKKVNISDFNAVSKALKLENSNIINKPGLY